MPQGLAFTEINPLTGSAVIRAICDAKGLCIPKGETWNRINKHFGDLSDNQASARRRQATVDRLIASAVTSDYSEQELPLWEEIDHFRYVAHSKTCSGMLLINPLIRWAHS